MHHSITRIELLSSFYLHPLDMASSLMVGLMGSVFKDNMSDEMKEKHEQDEATRKEKIRAPLGSVSIHSS